MSRALLSLNAMRTFEAVARHRSLTRAARELHVTAAAVSDPDTVRELLVRQVTGMVRWRESVLAMKEAGVSQVFEIGAGKVLTGLVKRIDREIAGQAVGEPADIEAALKLL